MSDITTRKQALVLILSITLGLFAINSFAHFAGGQGTAADPWQIETAEHLNNIRNYLGTTYNDKHFIQTADIDLGIAPWNTDEGWAPIGTNTARFQGAYDGDGYLIKGLTIDRNTQYQGLFGYGDGATVTNVRLENTDIIGGINTGGIFGYALNLNIENCYVKGSVKGTYNLGGIIGYAFGGTISGCYVTGEVVVSGTSTNGYIGGLVGFRSGNLTNCYSTAKVQGNQRRIGGLVGYKDGIIDNCYSIGTVAVTDEIEHVGGLVGQHVGGAVNNSFWNTETSGRTSSPGGGTGVTTAQMVRRETYQNAEWQFPEIWNIIEGETYPFLAWEEEPLIHNRPAPSGLSAIANREEEEIALTWEMFGSPAHYNVYRNNILLESVNHPTKELLDTNVEFYVNYQYYVEAAFVDGEDELVGSPSIPVTIYFTPFAGGDGTIDNPYQIDSPAVLSLVRDNLNAHFIQTANIDLYDATREGGDFWNDGEGWEPIGLNHDNSFTGSFNGDNYIIEGLFINRDEPYQSLFGYGDGATLTDVHLENVEITGGHGAGGLFGYALNTNIQDCYVRGNVRGTDRVGGITATVYNGTISECYMTGEVVGTSQYIGGIVGYFIGTSILTNCYSTARVQGYQTRIGGLVGYKNSGTINNCFSTGAVIVIDETNNVGGLMGQSSGAVNNSYWDTQTSGRTTSAGGLGRTTAEMTYPYAANTFTGWDFTDIWKADESLQSNDGYPYLEWQLVPPVNFVAVQDDRAVNLFWDAPVSGTVIGYNVYRNRRLIAELGVEQTQYIDENIDYHTEYEYYVTATLSNGRKTQPSRSVFCILHEPFAGGDGSEESPFQVGTAIQLNNLRYYLGEEHANKHFVQTANIDLYDATREGGAYWNDGDGWEPIGIEDNKYYGKYDGAGFEIDNLYINRPDTWYVGLFGYTEQATIINLGVTNVDITGNEFTGALVGRANMSTFSDSYSSGDVTGNSDYAGGLVGWTSGTINSSYSTSCVRGSGSRVGGLSGSTDGGTVSNCYATGSVTGGTDGVGGLIGSAHYSSIISYSYSTGSVFGERNQVGGLVGRALRSTTITNSYSTGSVTGEGNNIGGLVGNVLSNSTVNNSYWNTQTSGMTTSAGGLGRTTAEMTYPYAANTFTGWDFTDIWKADESLQSNDGYPFLGWQLVPPINFVAVQGDRVVNLYWDGPVLGAVTGYNVYRNRSLVTELNVEQTQYIDENLEYHTQYEYYVTATLSNGRETQPSKSVFCILHEPFAGGDGSEESPFQVGTAIQLNNLRYYLGEEHASKYFVQTASIDLYDATREGGTYWNDGKGWEPLGDEYNHYFSHYDGAGFEIDNLYINRPDTSFIGLFGVISSANIKNMKVLEANVTGFHHTGIIIGISEMSTIEFCQSSGSIAGEQCAGGIIGRHTTNSLIISCFSTANVVGSVTNSFESSRCGGVVGENRNSTVKNCFSFGEIRGINEVGGLVGYTRGDHAPTLIENCYSCGRVISTGRYVGGLNGRTLNTVSVVNSYWDTQTSGMTTSAGGLGRTTAEMTFPYAANTYEGWDFTNIWREDVAPSFNDGYPVLRWQKSPDPYIAVSLYPVMDTTNVSVRLEELRWEYVPDTLYVNPIGFRVYFSDNDEFGDDAEYDWVAYVENQVRYSTSDILPERLQYAHNYYWKVVPTTDEPEGDRLEDRTRRRNELQRQSFIARGDAQNVPIWRFQTELYPDPVAAVNRYPVDDTISVAVNLEELRWDYMVDNSTVNPVGFRVYFGNTNEFGETDNYGWVDYVEEREAYQIDLSELGITILEPVSRYYWQVIPTTIYGGDERSGGKTRRQSDEAFQRHNLLSRGDAANCPIWSFVTITTTPFVDQFDADYHWQFANGNAVNKWVIGDATSYTGEKAVYISNNNGENNSYNVNERSVVHLYRDILFCEDGFDFYLNFRWKGMGEGFPPNRFFDYMKVSVVDTDIIPIAGELLTEGAIGEPCLLQEDWRETIIYLPAEQYAGEIKRLVFTWVNDEQFGEQPPAAIDEVSIIKIYPDPLAAVNPNPANDISNVSVGLEELRWEYVVDSLNVNPVGFRVYFNDSNDFGDDDDYDWVAYVANQERYSTSDILPERLQYAHNYYWKVVPTTDEPEGGRSDDRTRRRSDIKRQSFIARGDAQNIPVWKFKTELYPNPVVAISPYPVNDSIDVAVNLEALSWDYVVDETTVNPVGFRVYFGNTDEFGETDNYGWVDYSEERVTYRFELADQNLLPLRYAKRYYWQVIPTTIYGGDGRSGDRTRRRNVEQLQRDNLFARGDAVNCPVWTFMTAYPEVALLSGERMFFGEVYLGDTSDTLNVWIKNTGTSAMSIDSLRFVATNNQYSVVGIELPLQVNVADSTSLPVIFRPNIHGVVNDSLFIYSNAVNSSVLSVSLEGRGEYVPPKMPDNVRMVLEGYDAVITWNEVTETIYESPIEVDCYIVLYNEEPEIEPDRYYFLAETDELTHTHYRVARHRGNMFYRVVAVKFRTRDGNQRRRLADRRLYGEKVTWGEVKEMLRSEW